VKITTYPYQLQFKYPFRISHGVRTHTDVVYVKIEHEGYTGWGEATLPPYLKETQRSVIEFVTAFAQQAQSLNLEECFTHLHRGSPKENTAARAAIDMALWSIKALQAGVTVAEYLQLPLNRNVRNTYTIGVCSPDELKLRLQEGLELGFEMFKLKLNGENDAQTVSSFTGLTDKPFAVDINQGWKTLEEASKMLSGLNKFGCALAEQPFSVSMDNMLPALTTQRLLPVYADESCQNLQDLIRLKGSVDGINIKLMKCGGITPALQMIEEARKAGLKILIGCMSESSVGCNAAAQLASLADYTDLDGPWLITNDPFTGIKLENGCVVTTVLEQLKKL
jgi:L-Ala-D/L-Glu epimerase